MLGLILSWGRKTYFLSRVADEDLDKHGWKKIENETRIVKRKGFDKESKWDAKKKKARKKTSSEANVLLYLESI